jgi:high-affinity iron transporter
VYHTAGGQIGEVYNIQAMMPEHPNDEAHYIRDTGHHPLINGQIGIFFKAFLGYTHNPSVEEFGVYWGYYLLVYLILTRRRKPEPAAAEAATAVVGNGEPMGAAQRQGA